MTDKSVQINRFRSFPDQQIQYSSRGIQKEGLKKFRLHSPHGYLKGMIQATTLSQEPLRRIMTLTETELGTQKIPMTTMMDTLTRKMYSLQTTLNG